MMNERIYEVTNEVINELKKCDYYEISDSDYELDLQPEQWYHVTNDETSSVIEIHNPIFGYMTEYFEVNSSTDYHSEISVTYIHGDEKMIEVDGNFVDIIFNEFQFSDQ